MAIIVLLDLAQRVIRSDPRDADQVVSTSMAESGESIEFRVEVDKTALCAGSSLKRCFEPVGVASHWTVMVFEELGHGVVRFVLF